MSNSKKFRRDIDSRKRVGNRTRYQIAVENAETEKLLEKMTQFYVDSEGIELTDSLGKNTAQMREQMISKLTPGWGVKLATWAACEKYPRGRTFSIEEKPVKAYKHSKATAVDFHRNTEHIVDAIAPSLTDTNITTLGEELEYQLSNPGSKFRDLWTETAIGMNDPEIPKMLRNWGIEKGTKVKGNSEETWQALIYWVCWGTNRIDWEALEGLVSEENESGNAGERYGGVSDSGDEAADWNNAIR